MLSIQKPHFEAQVMDTSLSEALELVKAIANKWDREKLHENEQKLLQEWERLTWKVLKYYLTRLGDTGAATMEDEGPFPKLEYLRMSAALVTIFHCWGPEKHSGHNKPSDLPFFDEIPPDKLASFGLIESPKISPLVVEIGLDCIGLQLFSSWRRQHEEWKSFDSNQRRAFVLAYVKFVNPHQVAPTPWWFLRGQLAVALTGSNFEALDSAAQSRVVEDLMETSKNVRKHQITPELFRDKVVKCVQKNISSPDLVDFGEVTRGLLISSKLYPVNDEGTSRSSSSNQAELTHRKRYIYRARRCAASYR